MQRKTATLADVAQRAGVSLSTASKALNGRPEVAPQTRERVEAVAQELQFSKSSRPGSTRSGTVGLLTADLEGRFVLPILMGAEDAFGAGQVSVLLCDARGDSIREQHHVRALLERRVDGIIVVGDTTNPRPSLGKDLAVPVIYAYAPSEDLTDVSLTPNNVQGGRLATEHLLTLGRTHIAHISGDPSYAAARDRARGVTEALAAANLELTGVPAFSAWSEQWGRDATAMLLGRHPEIDGIVCGSDQVARGVMSTLRELGHAVPQEVAIVGYDDWQVLSLAERPPLTSIDANLQHLGRAAAHALFDAIEGTPPEPGVTELPVRLVIRGSTIASA